MMRAIHSQYLSAQACDSPTSQCVMLFANLYQPAVDLATRLDKYDQTP